MNGQPEFDLFEAIYTTRSMRRLKPDPVPPELIVIGRTSPGLGMVSSSARLVNLTSLLAMVSMASFPSRRTRREGILRLISTVWAIDRPKEALIKATYHIARWKLGGRQTPLGSRL